MNKNIKLSSLFIMCFVCLFAFVGCTQGGTTPSDKEPAEHEHIWSSWQTITENANGVWGTVQRTCFSCNEVEERQDSLTTNISETMVNGTLYKVELSTLSDGKILRDYTLSTSNRRIVGIDSSGKYLQSKGFGTATITVSWNGFSIDYEVTVVDELTIEVPTEMACLTKSPVVCKNTEVELDETATLVSSNPEVLRVNSLQEVEALTEGSATLTLTWNGLTTSVDVNVVVGYYFDLDTELHVGDSSEINITSTRGEEISDYTVESSNPSVVELTEGGLKAVAAGESVLTFTYNEQVIGEVTVVVVDMSIEGIETMTRGGMQILSINFTPESYTETYTIESDDPEVLEVSQDGKVKALKPGTATVTVVTASGLTDSITITVNDVFYTVTFDLDEDDLALMPDGFVDSLVQFSIDDLPIALPELEKDQYAFLGWSINGKGSKNNLDDLSFDIPEGTNYNVKLETCWGVSRLELNYTNDQVLEPNETEQLVLISHMIAKNIDVTKQVWSSDNETVATVSNNGVVTAKNNGNCIINVYLEDNPNISTSIGITVMKDVASMSEVVNYFLENAINISIAKYINVTGYQFVYAHRLLGSVTNYLFEPLVIDETSYMVPAGTENRPGDVQEKYYVVVHDTASSASTADARAHGRYVVQGGGGTSWHYSVGNDGIYHHIPDNERAYHAGDGSRAYHLNETGIPGTNKYPEVTITADGYYALDGVKTPVAAPTYNGNILTTDKINDQGIRVVIKDGYYFIGDTYYNDTYHLISNTGGNKNSIGMETMVNEGSDIYYTWHKTAQLVAHLVKENNLTLDDVKPHHYFSGKNCPQTMRDNGLYENFLKMVACEYKMITDFAEYEVSLSTNFPEYISPNGRVIKQDAKDKSVSYTITFTKDGQSESITLWTVIPGYRK